MLKLHKELLGSSHKHLHGRVLPLQSLAGVLFSLSSSTHAAGAHIWGWDPWELGWGWGILLKVTVPGDLSCCWEGAD